MNYSNKFTIKYDNKIMNVELRNKHYKDKGFGYIHLYINNINNGVYLHYQIRKKLIPKSIEILNIPAKLSERYKNNGIGSRALKMLDLIAINHNINCIFGGISRYDYDHIDRLLFFYTKNNYEILLCNDKVCGISKIVR